MKTKQIEKLKFRYNLILTENDKNGQPIETIIIAQFNALGDAYAAASKLNEISPINLSYTVNAIGHPYNK